MTHTRETGAPSFHGPSTAELCMWCLALAAIAYWGEVIRGSPDPNPLSPAEIVNNVLETGAFSVAAWVMILARARRLVRTHPAAPALILSALGIGVLCAVPSRLATVLALALLGGGLLFRREIMPGGRQAGLLLLSLAFAWASTCMGWFHVLVATLDARLVAWILRLAGVDVRAQGNLVINGDFVIEVLTPCTSSAQLAAVVLAFIVIVLHRRGGTLADLPWLAAALLTSVVLTEARLSRMTLGEAEYLWWHSGPGYTI